MGYLRRMSFSPQNKMMNNQIRTYVDFIPPHVSFVFDLDSVCLLECQCEEFVDVLTKVNSTCLWIGSKQNITSSMF